MHFFLIYLIFWVSVYLFFSVILMNYWIIIIIKTTLFDMEITITLDNPYTFA